MKLEATMNNSAGNLDLIFGRRSIRVFSPGAIDEETVKRLLEAAMAAPSAMTKDPWRFVVVRQPERLQQLASALPGGKMLPGSALAIVVCGDQEAAFEQKRDYLLQDCSAAIENLLLAVHAMGLGGCWVGIYPAEASVLQVKQMLRLPPRVLPIACLAIGRPGEELPARTRYEAGFVHQEQWTE